MEKKKGKKHPIRNIFLVICVGILMIIAVIAIKLKSMECPELRGQPETGTWYKVTLDDAVSADGSKWHGLFKKGSENKVIVYFQGGGVSLNEESSKNSPEWFYIPNVGIQDYMAQGGIFSAREDNPFKDWSVIMVSYATGDFHVGQNELKLSDTQTVHHQGYDNYSIFMDAVIPYIGEPDSLVITGSSAGGFAASMLSDDVMQRIPSATNRTVCVDSALLYYDGWKETASHIWNAPEEIQNRLHSNNIVLDNLQVLNDKYHNQVKILFTSSIYDKDLQRYQAYIDYGKLEETEENSVKYKNSLKQMVSDMNEILDNPGFYLYQAGINEKTGSTQHMIIIYENVFDKLVENQSAAEWLMEAVNGNIESYGLDLLSE